MTRSPGKRSRAVTAALIAATFLTGTLAEPLHAQEAGAPESAAQQEESDRRSTPPGWRKWVFALGGAAVFGVPAITAESLPDEIGGCTTSACFGTLAAVVGASIGFLIGHEMDEKAARRAAVGPTMERATRRVELPVVPSKVIPHERGALVLGRQGFASVTRELTVEEVGRSLRGITAATVFPAHDAILASTTAGLYAFGMGPGESTGKLVHQTGGVDLAGVDEGDVVVASTDLLHRLRLSGTGVSLEFSETARAPQSGIFSEILWVPYAGILWSVSRDRLVARSPSDLTELGSTRLPGEARTLSISGDKGVIAAGRNGVYLVDVSDPAAPRATGRVTGMAFAHDAALVGNEAFIATGDQGLMVVDITDPENVAVEGVLRELGFVSSVAARGDDVYVLDRRNSRLHVVSSSRATAGGE